MDSILTVLLIALGLVWLYLCIVSMHCVARESDLETGQRIGQILLILILPYAGAVLALKFISQYSPELVAKYYIPPPFSGMIIEPPLRNPGGGHNDETITGEWSKGMRNLDGNSHNDD